MSQRRLSSMSIFILEIALLEIVKLRNLGNSRIDLPSKDAVDLACLSMDEKLHLQRKAFE
ncbi:hypothetical protein L915_11873 [Phytophthora nicotianae]|uniref:Uncharacterized protein n=1 Tax=Phytophthora nicotianae TaxID=4792 RepID=W2GIH9_PHYNI|nr:hypothetical protein L915_11873 [Phytophthora nicotianae]